MVLASVIAGASGGALANVALSPLGGGAGLLQSYWYGAGLILGERMMYTFHWEKIKKRLDGGEDFMSVLESEMTPNINAIATFSLDVMKKTGNVYMQGGIDFMAKMIENLLKLLAGEDISTPPPDPCPEGFTRDVNGICQPDAAPIPTPDCPSGFRWSASAQQCVPEDIPEPGPELEPTPEPITEPSILQDFSSLNLLDQENILARMATINDLNTRYGISPTAVQIQTIDQHITTWKQIYLKVGGYINPRPVQAMPWLHQWVLIKLSNWQALL